MRWAIAKKYMMPCCRDTGGTGEPPFAVFVGEEDASSPGSYTVLDNTNCTAYSAQFSAGSQVLTLPCTRQGRYVVIKSTIGPLVLCEVQVYGALLSLSLPQQVDA